MEHYQNKYIPILINEILEPVFNETQIEKIREYFKTVTEVEAAQTKADATQKEADETQKEADKKTRAVLAAIQMIPHTEPQAEQTEADAAQTEADAAQAVQKEEKQQIFKSIFDVENNFLENFFDEESKYDFGITKILKGEIFDITASSKNNELGNLKSGSFKYATSLKDIIDELKFIKENTEEDDKSSKRQIRLNFIDNCIQLDKVNIDDEFNQSGSFNKLFKYLTAYINGSNTIDIPSEQFLVKNSGGNIFKLYSELLYLIFEDKIDEIEKEFINMVAIQEAEAEADAAEAEADAAEADAAEAEAARAEAHAARAKADAARAEAHAARAKADAARAKAVAAPAAASAATGEDYMDTTDTTPTMPILFQNIQKIMINMFNGTSPPEPDKYSIYNSLRNNMRLIRLQNYSDIDSYIIQNPVTVAGEGGAPAQAPMDTHTPKTPTQQVEEEIKKLKGTIGLLPSDKNTIENTIHKIKSIESIQYIFQQILDTLNDGIENIENIKGTLRQKKARIKSIFNNTLKEINSIIDNYDKIVRKQVKEAQAQAQSQAHTETQAPVPASPAETEGFLLFRIKSYNKILGFNTEDEKINYNIKELLIKLELINELNKEIVKNISHLKPDSKYDYLPSYNNLHTKVQGILPSPLYPQVFQADFLEINNKNAPKESIEKKILGHLFLKSLQYEKELMRISTYTNSKKLLKSDNFNNNIKNLHKIFNKINTDINSAPTAPAGPAVPADFTNLPSLLKSNSLIEAMIKALNAFNNKTKDSEININYNEQYNKNANSEIPGKMTKSLLGETDDEIKTAYNIMIQYIDSYPGLTNYQLDFKNQLLNFIAIKTSDKIEI